MFEPGIAVTDLTSFKRRRRSGLPQVPMRRVELVVLVSDLTRPIRDAIAYAESLGQPVRTIHVDVDDAQRDKVLHQWSLAGYPYELELVPSPYREVTSPLVGYIRDRRRLCLPGTLVNVVIPEFIVPGRLSTGIAQPDRAGGQGGARPGARGGGHQRAVPPRSQDSRARLTAQRVGTTSTTAL